MRRGILIQIIILVVLLVVLFVLVGSLQKEKTAKENNTEKKQIVSEIYYEVPYIYDAKAVLKAQYLDLSNYEPLQFINCLKDINNCNKTNLKITAYIYKNANEEFCNNLKNKLVINNDTYFISNLNELKNVCLVFYKMKNKILEKKDCINPEVVPICDYYFSLKETDFIKSNLQLLNLINNPQETPNCLSLEKTAAYYCLKIKNISCNSFENVEEVKKCNKLLVNHDQQYKEFLNEVENIVKNEEWEKLKELILSTNDSKKLHALARLGAIKYGICSVFSQKNEKEHRYCLKRYYNQNFLCDLSPDKRQCYLFDVILNDKDCSLLKDPQHQTDCELFKKYIGKEDCNFFYTVAADKYLGYLCAVKTGRCDDKAYYDEMYKINCKYLTGKYK